MRLLNLELRMVADRTRQGACDRFIGSLIKCCRANENENRSVCSMNENRGNISIYFHFNEHVLQIEFVIKYPNSVNTSRYFSLLVALRKSYEFAMKEIAHHGGNNLLFSTLFLTIASKLN